MKLSGGTRWHSSGFTLLELLAAVSLLAVGFFVVLTAMGNATTALLRSDNATQMAFMARSIFDEHARGPLAVGQSGGSKSGVQWKLTTSILRDTAPVRIFQLDLMLERDGRQESFRSLAAQGLNQ